MLRSAAQPAGSKPNVTPLSKAISTPGSVSSSRCWTVTDHDTDEVVVLYVGFASVMLGHDSSRWRRMRLGEDAGISWPSMNALTVNRTRLLSQMCSMEVASVIVTSPPAGTSHSHPVATASQDCEDSMTVVPMLDAARSRSVASVAVRL